MFGMVLRALVEAGVAVCQEALCVQRNSRGRNHQSQPSQTPARCQVNQRLAEHRQRRVGARHEIELPS